LPPAAKAFAKAGNLVELFRAQAAKATITVHKLRGNVSVLEGSGGNIAVLPGPDGKLLVDAGITATRPRIADALAMLSKDPITRLINTHWHFDHADGNAWLNAEGASIVAHENTRKHLSNLQRVEDWDFDFPAFPPHALPSEVFAGDKTIKANGATLLLNSYRPAHTDSDISVRFAEADVVHVADTYWNGMYPFIDYSTGGSIDGMIRASEANIAAMTDTTIVIPGHGAPVSDRTGVVAFCDMLTGVRDNVAELKKQGHSLDEIVAAKPTAAYDEKWGQSVISPALFTKLVFEGV
jgi:glyoxylase-like metal-dependent hydrolase (beta-lactamase superfamily II)